MRFLKLSTTLSASLTAMALSFAACGDDAPRKTSKPAITAPAKPRPAPIAEPAPVPEPVAVAPVATPEPEPAPAPEPPKTFGEAMDRGKQLRADGAYEEALAMFEIARGMKPGSAIPHVELARVYIELKDAAKAREHAEEAVDIWPSGSSAWNTLGRVELLEGDLDAAVASFERAVEENEDNSFAWNNLGYTLLRQERYEEAGEALERAVSGTTVMPYMWNNLGMAYEHQDRIVEARAAYGKARDGGSTIAAKHFDRLEGVTSVAQTDDDAEPESSTELE